MNRHRQPGSSSLRSASLLPRDPASATPLFSAPSTLFSRVRIHLIPLNLRFLCFHTLTHSFASSNITTSFFSIAFALFSQKHPGGGSSLPTRVLARAPLQPSSLPTAPGYSRRSTCNFNPFNCFHTLFRRNGGGARPSNKRLSAPLCLFRALTTLRSPHYV